MKIGIIGSGWLAQPLAMQFQGEGHEIHLTTTQQDKVAELQAKGLSSLQFELGDQLSEPAQLFDGDILIIAITSKEVDSFDVLMDQLIAWDLLSVQACKHLIYISSTAVYQNDGKQHDETSQRLDHTNSLLEIERLIQHHPSASIIRFAGLVGPERHPGKFFSHGRKPKNPDAPVNLIHLDDCIGIIKAVIENQAWKQVFNGCADTHPSKIEFYTYMSMQLKLTAPEFENSSTGSTGSYKIIDNHKVKSVLDYQFIYPDVKKMIY